MAQGSLRSFRRRLLHPRAGCGHQQQGCHRATPPSPPRCRPRGAALVLRGVQRSVQVCADAVRVQREPVHLVAQPGGGRRRPQRRQGCRRPRPHVREHTRCVLASLPPRREREQGRGVCGGAVHLQAARGAHKEPERCARPRALHHGHAPGPGRRAQVQGAAGGHGRRRHQGRQRGRAAAGRVGGAARGDVVPHVHRPPQPPAHKL
mmetsp:Transcript_16363/g.38469  ORF Transcript_16363/g.38469 Transcript_16363/m.38469 type:complete len:206 (-) Transcript_16363:979-1596(-)